MTRRNAANRAIESFIVKYPQYEDRIYLHGQGHSVTFKGEIYRESIDFMPYTERMKIWGWLNECRRTDERLLQKREQKEIEANQGKLI